MRERTVLQLLGGIEGGVAQQLDHRRPRAAIVASDLRVVLLGEVPLVDDARADDVPPLVLYLCSEGRAHGLHRRHQFARLRCADEAAVLEVIERLDDAGQTGVDVLWPGAERARIHDQLLHNAQHVWFHEDVSDRDVEGRDHTALPHCDLQHVQLALTACGLGECVKHVLRFCQHSLDVL